MLGTIGINGRTCGSGLEIVFYQTAGFQGHVHIGAEVVDSEYVYDF